MTSECMQSSYAGPQTMLSDIRLSISSNSTTPRQYPNDGWLCLHPVAVSFPCKLQAEAPSHPSNLDLPLYIWLRSVTSPLWVKDTSLTMKVGLTQPAEMPEDQSWEFPDELCTSISRLKVYRLLAFSRDSSVTWIHRSVCWVPGDNFTLLICVFFPPPLATFCLFLSLISFLYIISTLSIPHLWSPLADRTFLPI